MKRRTGAAIATALALPLGSTSRTRGSSRDRAGQSGEVSVEYAMIIALVVLLLVATLTQLGNALNDIFVRIAEYF